MNVDRICTVWLQFSGWLNQGWGELSGNAVRAAAGRTRILAMKRRFHALSEEESAWQLKDFHQRNRIE